MQESAAIFTQVQAGQTQIWVHLLSADSWEHAEQSAVLDV